MQLTHHKWEKSGRTFKTEKPNQFCYTSRIGEQQTWDGLQWLPYLWKSANSHLQYGHNSEEIEFASDKQILKSAGKALVSSSKFFVQKETSPGVWENQPHGIPTKNIAQDYPEEGRCTGYLNFPDAQYDLKIGLEVGRSQQAVFGFKFRAPISGKVRFVWVNDGIEKLPQDWEWIWARYLPFKGKEDRKVGIRFKDIEWRWSYNEAPFREINVIKVAGKRKLEIIFGPYDYAANEWLTVYPDTWGPISIQNTNDDGSEINDASMDLDGADEDGNITGHDLSSNDHDTCWRWDDVAVSGTAENGCLINLEVTYRSGDINAILYGIDETDPADWNSGTRPSQRGKTTASISWAPAGTGSQSSGEIKTIIQELIDDGHSSGNAMAFVLIEGVDSGWVFIQSHDYETTITAAQRAELTIVYTAAAPPAGVVPQAYMIMRG